MSSVPHGKSKQTRMSDFMKSGIFFRQQTVRERMRTGALWRGGGHTDDQCVSEDRRPKRETVHKYIIKSMFRQSAEFHHILRLLFSLLDIVFIRATKTGLYRGFIIIIFLLCHPSHIKAWVFGSLLLLKFNRDTDVM